MAAEPEVFLFDLFDSYWFTHQIFNKTQNPPPIIPQNKDPVPETTQNLDFSAIPTINVRCHSDQIFISSKQRKFISDSPNLATIFSGKEAKEHEEIKEIKLRRGRKRNIRSRSKSLSELEFEEVKGFMDLGFLFSEKDKDSRLVSMIPGLQRLGEDERGHVDGDVNVSRPYLSEAWGSLEKTRVRLPVLGDESDIKQQIRFWAHSVAAVVR